MGAVLPIVSIGATALGAVTGAIGARQQAAAASQNAAYQSQVARNNQIIAEQNAVAAQQTGQARAMNVGLRSRALFGRVRASQAASGIDVNSGSPVDVQETQRRIGELDQLTEAHNAELQAYGYRAQGANYGAEAGLDTMRAQQAQSAGGLGVASSLISGAGALANRFSWMSMNDGFGPFAGQGYGGIGPGTGGLY